MKEKINYHEHDEIDTSKFPTNSNVASSTECTGLIPSPPLNNSEQDSYQDLSSMEIPKGKQNIENTIQKNQHDKIDKNKK